MSVLRAHFLHDKYIYVVVVYIHFIYSFAYLRHCSPGYISHSALTSVKSACKLWWASLNCWIISTPKMFSCRVAFAVVVFAPNRGQLTVQQCCNLQQPFGKLSTSILLRSASAGPATAALGHSRNVAKSARVEPKVPNFFPYVLPKTKTGKKRKNSKN